MQKHSIRWAPLEENIRKLTDIYRYPGLGTASDFCVFTLNPQLFTFTIIFLSKQALSDKRPILSWTKQNINILTKKKQGWWQGFDTGVLNPITYGGSDQR